MGSNPIRVTRIQKVLRNFFLFCHFLLCGFDKNKKTAIITPQGGENMALEIQNTSLLNSIQFYGKQKDERKLVLSISTTNLGKNSNNYLGGVVVNVKSTNGKMADDVDYATLMILQTRKGAEIRKTAKDEVYTSTEYISHTNCESILYMRHICNFIKKNHEVANCKEIVDAIRKREIQIMTMIELMFESIYGESYVMSGTFGTVNHFISDNHAKKLSALKKAYKEEFKQLDPTSLNYSEDLKNLKIEFENYRHNFVIENEINKWRHEKARIALNPNDNYKGALKALEDKYSKRVEEINADHRNKIAKLDPILLETNEYKKVKHLNNYSK